VENYQGSAMKINWVVADSMAVDPTIDAERLKNVGSIWGGWKTWRSCSTDNVVCHNLHDARKLISKSFHIKCNLYLSQSNYQELDRPLGVKLYQGDFHLDVDRPDEIVSLHLASTNSDIVLLLGFDLNEKNLDSDKLAKHKWHVYKNYVRQIIADKPDIQWVLLGSNEQLDKEFKKLKNLQFDSLDNVLKQIN
jgi:hypothetical protein